MSWELNELALSLPISERASLRFLPLFAGAFGAPEDRVDEVEGVGMVYYDFVIDRLTLTSVFVITFVIIGVTLRVQVHFMNYGGH